MSIAYCGLVCDACPILLATLEQDKSHQQILRESIARQCTELYGIPMKAENITDCDGCRADTGRLFSGCLGCEIRKCAKQKNTENCAFCADYVCERLEHHFSLDPDAHARLEEIRKKSRV